MTLEFSQVAPQLQAMGQNLAQRTKIEAPLLAQAKELLHTHSTAFANLNAAVTHAEKVQQSVRFSWLGAAPANEPLAEYHAPPPMPARATVIASDGSQIHPNQHDIALYYLVNVGAIVYRHGSGEKPDTTTEAQLFYKEEDLLTNQGLLISPSVVNVKRDVAEIDILARLAPAYPSDDPLITFIDGQLTLRLIDLPANQQDFYLQQYLARLSTLQKNNATIAAYIDRPRSGFVLSLLHLASLEPDNITAETLRSNPFVRLTDAKLFNDLPPGYRSAIFNQRAKANIAYAKAGHQIHFFYLNTGTHGAPNIVRVEIPGWIAKNPARLNVLHAVLLKQATITGGYPYVLARAHELAIIPPAEREALETMLAISLRKNGVPANVSLKQANKNALWQ